QPLDGLGRLLLPPEEELRVFLAERRKPEIRAAVLAHAQQRCAEAELASHGPYEVAPALLVLEPGPEIDPRPRGEDGEARAEGLRSARQEQGEEREAPVARCDPLGERALVARPSAETASTDEHRAGIGRGEPVCGSGRRVAVDERLSGPDQGLEP